MADHPTHDKLATMADDIRQLTQPIHTAIRGRIVTHGALLDQLRAAAEPGRHGDAPERRGVPSSRPPGRLDPVDALATVYVELSGWHAKLRLPSPPAYAHGCHHGSCRRILLGCHPHRPLCAQAALDRVDWHKAVLRQLVGEAPNLAPSIADWLAADVDSWWRLAATAAGWRPTDLLRLR